MAWRFPPDRAVSPACVVRGGLLPRLWAEGRTVSTLLYHHNHSATIFNHINFVLVYTNVTKDVLNKASDSGKLERTQWLVLLEKEDQLATLHDHVNALDLFIDSTLLLATFRPCQAQYLQSVYRVGPKSRVLVEGGGEWSPTDGYVGVAAGNKYDRRRNFQGYPIVGVGVKVFDLYTTYLPNGRLSGYIGDILNVLKMAHNFSLSYSILKGYAYGSLVNGSSNKWTGMVGELQQGRADLTVSELSITKERNDVVTYTQPVFVVSRRLYVSTPQDFRKKLLAYVDPMDKVVYVCVFVAMSVMALGLNFVERLRLYFLPSEEEPVSLSVAAWSMVSALLQQGYDPTPSSTAARIIFWVGFVVSLIVYTAYSATLMAHLAVEKPAPLPFSNLRQLSRQTRWDAGPNNNDLFQVTASQTCAGSQTEECRVMQDVWNKVVLRSPGNIVNSYNEGLQKVLKGKYVFIGVDVNTNYYIRNLPSKDACRVKELPGQYITGGIAIGLQKRSPFRGVFDYSLQRMKEIGVMKRLVATWLKVGRSCSLQTTVNASLTDLAAVFILLFMGISASLLVLGGEIVVSRSKKRQPTHDDT
ncbi:glutamate receptor 1 [Procambarus clarkii]|uniref:glutamate receptor 1 n=1 Tax=Procambarus clarkii TaxID=6728 RepID=UPI003743E8BE